MERLVAWGTKEMILMNWNFVHNNTVITADV